jgi:PepSY-associated TM region
MKRWLYLVHRWAGIALCVVMALWFLSGIVMLYVGYPKLTDEERWQGLPNLSTERCCVPMAQALQAAGLAGREGKAAGNITWRLTSVAGTPTYVFGDGSKLQVAVDARSGQRVAGASADDALHAARHFAGGVVAAQAMGTVDEDAWTHSRALDAHRPLHRVAVDDAEHRWLYVSSRTGEVVREATRVERTWGWIGAWLHWLYIFRGGPLDRWWTDIVIWLSVAGGVLALTGMVVGILRWRFKRPYRNGQRTPYTGFNARWHHLLGMVGGVLAVTWVISGLLSMNPWKVFNSDGAKPDRAAYAGGQLLATQAPEATATLEHLQQRGVAVKELEWRRVAGMHLVLAHGAGATRVLDARGLLDDGLPDAQWRAAARALLPGAHIVEQQRLTEFDRYYLAREPHTMGGHRDRPLPAWRLRFDDPNETWVTIDPHTGNILQVLDGHRRADRWLFAFLHSFDLPALLNARPLWDVWMVGFSLAGLGLSLTGVVTGWRRLRKKWHSRWARPLRPELRPKR